MTKKSAAQDDPLSGNTDLAVGAEAATGEEAQVAEALSADQALAELSPAEKAQRDKEFETELMPHIRSLYHFAYRLTGDEENANDLVQDTYLKAYRFFNSYEKGSNAKAWLFRILKNSFINNYRKTSKEPGKVDYEEAETYLNTGKSQYSDSIDLRDKLFRGLVGDEITQALSRLPVDFRTVIILCDIEEFTYEEIAKIVDIPIGTVRSRLHRARKMLREMLLDYAVSMGYDTEEDSEAGKNDPFFSK
jgi:RNA polymerase sigma-70 factor (ECF subfamily)